ncbi:MAG TPA: prepilin-type N-terminal cleavage/methylation domain-containing protein [Blastocatellia bacterium]|nr:prepilin-type N-terminal cleavage/methylation domain-containing protein [Blastocatellia bacterium]
MKQQSAATHLPLLNGKGQPASDGAVNKRRFGQLGFTVTELLVVIAVVAVLIGLLLPSAQAVREANNRTAVRNSLPDICCAARDFHEQNGRFPASFAELIRLCEDKLPNLRTECCSNVLGLMRLGLPMVNGYIFTITEASESTWKLQAVPASPGKTGSLGFMIDQDCNVSSFPIPDAGVIRERMFTKILAKGAEVVTELFNSTDVGPSAIPLARDFVRSPDTLPIVFSALDSNGDEVVTPQEILSRGPGPGGFIDFIKEEMEFGAGNEDVSSLPGVSLSDLKGDNAAALFSYEGLCHLTQLFVQHHGVADSLCAKLTAAEAAEARGNARAKAGALRAYRNEVAAHSGKTLTDREATILTTLSQTL